MPHVEYSDQNIKYYIDGYLNHALEAYYKYVHRKEQDNSFIVAGREGRGKTTLAIQILKRQDPTFNEERIFTNSEELIKALEKAEPFQGFLYDEAQEFTSRAALSRLNRNLVRALSMMRVKRLFIGFCIPSFFELEKYAAIHRTEFLIEVFTHKGRWGFFKYWSWKKKKELYLLGKKTYDYKKVKPNFFGRFTKDFIVDFEKYNKRKLESIQRALTKDAVVDKKGYYNEYVKRFQDFYKSIIIVLLEHKQSYEEIVIKVNEVLKTFNSDFKFNKSFISRAVNDYNNQSLSYNNEEEENEL